MSNFLLSPFSLKQALLLSPISKAKSGITDPGNIGPFHRWIYQLVVTCYEPHGPDGHGAITLNLHQITYPDSQPGKGRGEMLVGKSYRTVQHEKLDEMITYLTEFGFNVDEGWIPVDEEE